MGMETGIIKQIADLSKIALEKVYNEVEHSAYINTSEQLKDDKKVKAELSVISDSRDKIKASFDEKEIVFDIGDITDNSVLEVERKICESITSTNNLELYISKLVKYNCLGVLQKELTLKLIESASRYIPNFI